MSFVRLWVHVVFATKNREPVLKKEIRHLLYEHIQEQARLKSIMLDCINGYEDHVHCLVALHANQTTAKVVQAIKGESSHWLNRSTLLEARFEWQDDYYAVSVSEAHVQKVRRYIAGQEEHHQYVSYWEEAERFAKKYGITLGIQPS
jgi:putative transposase